jgi:hypothetical protein
MLVVKARDRLTPEMKRPTAKEEVAPLDQGRRPDVEDHGARPAMHVSMGRRRGTPALFRLRCPHRTMTPARDPGPLHNAP